MQASFALLEKYSKPGPRYTSYPTAPYFSTAFCEAGWRAERMRSQASGRDLSLYVHIPFCDSLCYYCSCADGLVEINPEKVRVTEAGRIFLRSIATAFDAYLHQGAAPRYSRTV